MRTTFKFLTTVTFLFFLHSCKIQKQNEVEKVQLQGIEWVVNYINNCLVGGQTKALYLKSNKTLILYTGNSLSNYFQKWEIPVLTLDPESIKSETGFMSGNRVYFKTINNEESIRANEEGVFEDFASGTSYYMGGCAKDTTEVELFKTKLKEAIISIQN